MRFVHRVGVALITIAMTSLLVGMSEGAAHAKKDTAWSSSVLTIR
ncbi:MAG: hypothetical protein ACRCYU_07045 [Nocardioides sp.]